MRRFSFLIIVTIIAMSLLAAQVALAGGGKKFLKDPPATKPLDRLDKALNSLNLAPEQRAKLDEVLSQAQDKMLMVRDQAKKSPDKMMAKAKAHVAAAEMKVQVLEELSATQRAALKAKLKAEKKDAARP